MQFTKHIIAPIIFYFAFFITLNSFGGECLKFNFTPLPRENLEAQQKEHRKKINVPLCAAAPAIDGKLDDEAWKKAGILKEFNQPTPKTTVRFCVDENTLYIALDCTELPNRKPMAKEVERDGNLWGDDLVEMWFANGVKRKYHIVVNPAGSVYDALNMDSGYNPEIKVAGTRRTDGWSIEIALPKSALLGAEGDPWPAMLGFDAGRAGPLLKSLSWSGEWGNTDAGALAIEGGVETLPQMEAQTLGSRSDVVVAGSSMLISADRIYARPGDRWIEIQINLRPAKALDKTRLEAKLFELSGTTPLDSVSIAPARRAGYLCVDLRSKNLACGEVLIEFFEGDKRTGIAKLLLTTRPCAEPVTPGERIPIALDVPRGIAAVQKWPITFGFPFAAGALWNTDALRLVDNNGREISFQVETTGLWAKEGAIKWVRIDALVSSADGCFVEIGRNDKAEPTPPFGHPSVGGELSGKSPPGPGSAGGSAEARRGGDSSAVAHRAKVEARVGQLQLLTLNEKDGKIIVDTGAAVYTLGKGISPIIEIMMSGRKIASCAKSRGLYVVDQNGRIGSASAEDETILVESRGPVASCVRFEGWYATDKGEKLARHITRVECFAGQPFAKITHTLVITEDTNKRWFKEIGWEFNSFAGAKPEAVFGISRAEYNKSVNQELKDGVKSAYMLQDSHYRFGHGTNHFVVASLGPDSQAKTLMEGVAVPEKSAEQPKGDLPPVVPTPREDGTQGGECGDWALLSGSDGKLAICCRETARQHPKEFEISADKILLRLFSNRTGEELDFRSPALVRKWNLKDWSKHTVIDAYRNEKLEEIASKYETSALGWSKTHEICLLPMQPDESAEQAGKTAKLNADPVIGHVSPEWIYRSKVMGPLHPRDTKNYPEAEKAIQATLDFWKERVPEFGEYGFMDYYTGPHLEYHGKYPALKRWRYTYLTRPGLWLAYARSSDRSAYDCARDSNLTYMDGFMCHWDGPRRVKGHFALAYSDTDDGASIGCLPYHWGECTDINVSSTTDLNQALWMYYLTGNRRARDCIVEFAEGTKIFWGPSRPRRDRPLQLLKVITQCYSLTWDPELRAMADATADWIYDPEGEILITKEQNYGGTHYKTWCDIRALIEAWEIFGQRRYYDMVMKVSNMLWGQYIGAWPVSYTNPQGPIGYFLFQETGDLSIPEILKVQIRQASKGIANSAESVNFYFEGIPYAQSVIEQAGALKKNVASWVAFDGAGFEANAIVKKNNMDKHIDITASKPGDMIKTGGNLKLEPLPAKKSDVLVAIGHGAHYLNYVWEPCQGAGRARIAKDAPECEVKIIADGFIFCGSKVPLVLYAPSYWQPLPQKQLPSTRIFFKVPEGTKDGQIFVEGSIKLFDPAGKPFKDGIPQSKWVDLPENRPGLWSFAPVANNLVRVRNLPPFFAFSDPANYFEPDITWKREEKPAAANAIPPETVYVPGVIDIKDNQALYLAGKRTFTLPAGEPHPSGNGSQFLPFKEGTIEFFFKPDWSTFEAPKTTYLVSLPTVTKKDPWALSYRNYPNDARPELNTHVLNGFLYSDGDRKHVTLQCWRKNTFFEAGEWVHLAWVWGQRDGIFTSWGDKKVLIMQVYVNGKLGQQTRYKHPGNLPADQPAALVLTGDMKGAVDELRVSDHQRYTTDFMPPARDRELTLDKNTRALFNFNGNVDGQSYGATSALPVQLK